MSIARTGNPRRSSIGALTCVCLALQPLLIPLHLILYDHVVFREVVEHLHSEARSPHGHAHPHADEVARHQVHENDPGEEHPPHPAEDHFEQLAEPAVPPLQLGVVLAPAPDTPWFLVHDLPSHEGLGSEDRAPRAPPPRSASAPRAPPIVV